MSLRGYKRVTPVRFIAKMRGGSQSTLIEACDGKQYVVKWQQNPQGSRVVPNEALGTALYQEIGLPTPEWAAIEISDAFIDANRGMWFDTGNGFVRPTSGLHFASSRMGTKSQTVFEVLPSTWFTRIQNRDTLLGALVADVWSEHVDSRQALFVQDDGQHSLAIVYIDHGHMFGGADGAQVMRLRACFHLDIRMYASLKLVDGLNYWIQRIQDNGEAIIARAVESIPEEWVSTAVNENIYRLLNNLPGLRDILFPAVFRWIIQDVQKCSQGLAYEGRSIVA